MSFLSFFVTLSVTAGSIAGIHSASINGTQCQDDEYYDHGVRNCEPCTDYCKAPNVPSYVKLCEEHCPIVYRQMQDKAQKPEVELVPGASTSQSSDTSATDKALIGGIIGSVALIAIIVVVVIAARRALRKRNGAHAQTAVRGTPAGNRLTPTGVQEENNDQAASERQSQTEGLLGWGWCGSRWVQQETPSGQRGGQEIALLGSSQGSGIHETSLATPIYIPSGVMSTTSRV
ncbi:uncharacterized protein [Littorina saxatilis]|uniref:uncharacterized protein n=1 Tax=Littorina saxatilis TaxID=31220 RepID=UPI0038B59859